MIFFDTHKPLQCAVPLKTSFAQRGQECAASGDLNLDRPAVLPLLSLLRTHPRTSRTVSLFVAAVGMHRWGLEALRNRCRPPLRPATCLTLRMPFGCFCTGRPDATSALHMISMWLVLDTASMPPGLFTACSGTYASSVLFLSDRLGRGTALYEARACACDSLCVFRAVSGSQDSGRNAYVRDM